MCVCVCVCEYFHSWSFLRFLYRGLTIHSQCTTKLHDRAPDIDLMTLTGGAQRLLGYMETGRPLVSAGFLILFPSTKAFLMFLYTNEFVFLHCFSTLRRPPPPPPPP